MDRRDGKPMYHVFIACILLILPFGMIRAQEESEDEGETSWTASLHTLYENKDNSRGVDLSEDLATLLYGVRLEHTSGFSLDVGAANLLGSSGGFERWNATLGYSHAVSSWLVLSGELSEFKYANDSLNAIANLTNSFALGATFQSSVVNVGLSYGTYFGGGSANYYGISFDHTFQKEKLTIDPALSFSFISQTIDQKRLVSYKKILKSGKPVGRPGVSSSTAVTVTGLSGITLAVGLNYDLGGGFTVEAHPTYVNSPKAELAANTSEFLWSIGLTYSKDF